MILILLAEGFISQLIGRLTELRFVNVLISTHDATQIIRVSPFVFVFLSNEPRRARGAVRVHHTQSIAPEKKKSTRALIVTRPHKYPSMLGNNLCVLLPLRRAGGFPERHRDHGERGHHSRRGGRAGSARGFDLTGGLLHQHAPHGGSTLLPHAGEGNKCFRILHVCR